MDPTPCQILQLIINGNACTGANALITAGPANWKEIAIARKNTGLPWDTGYNTSGNSVYTLVTHGMDAR